MVIETFVLVIVLVVLATCLSSAAYRNGFRDGALWAVKGETYPSKPPRDWQGWRDLRDDVRRSRMGEP